MVLALALILLQPQVHDLESFRLAVSRAKPGDAILLAPGRYPGGLFFGGIHGTKEKPITIGGSDPQNPPVFAGGNTAVQISKARHLVIQNLIIEDPKLNGLNIDDGSDYEKRSTFITIKNIHIRNLPAGNHDGIKLSGIEHFAVENCTIESWGGSGIDMVGCHQGVVRNCHFENGGDSGVQAKGGSTGITVEECQFKNPGHRGVNIGGSTGREFFRPPLASVPEGSRFEAQAITVRRCTFIGGATPVAFVGVDGAIVEYNTIYHPGRWAARILQETRSPDFLPSRNGQYRRNLVIYRSDQWASGGINIGDLTQPDTFRFEANLWHCSDNPRATNVRLPGRSEGNRIGENPDLIDPSSGNFLPKSSTSLGAEYGAFAKTES